MTLKSIAVSELPEQSRPARKSKFSPKQIAEAVETLLSGNAIVPDATFKK